MPQKKHKPEEIVAKLRQVDVLLSQGRPVAEAIRAISVTAFTYYRWRKEFGGLKSDQVKRLKVAPPEDLRRANFVAFCGESGFGEARKIESRICLRRVRDYRMRKSEGR